MEDMGNRTHVVGGSYSKHDIIKYFVYDMINMRVGMTL